MTDATDQPEVIYVYAGRRKRDGTPGEFLAGIPARDLTERDVARLSDEHREFVEGSGLYRPAGEERRDPLGELSNEDYAALTPAEKGARTRKANELRRDAEQGAGSGEGAGDGESAGEASSD